MATLVNEYSRNDYVLSKRSGTNAGMTFENFPIFYYKNNKVDSNESLKTLFSSCQSL